MEIVLSVIGLTGALAAVLGTLARWWRVSSANDELVNMLSRDPGKTLESLARQLRVHPSDPTINKQVFKILMETLDRSTLRESDKAELKDRIRRRGPGSVLRAG